MINKIADIVKGRPVLLCLGGNSIAELYDLKRELSDRDICFMGMNVFTPTQELVNSMGHKMEIVFDSATVAESNSDVYESKIRLPRLDKYLSKDEKNLLVTSHGLVRDVFTNPKYDWFYKKHSAKIFEIDNVFPVASVGEFMAVPNSATLAIASAYAGGASKIAVLGCDGQAKQVNSYFKSEEHIKERITALGTVEDRGISGDAVRFELEICDLVNKYKKLFNNPAPIVNCSRTTIHTALQRIMYADMEDFLDGN